MNKILHVIAVASALLIFLSACDNFSDRESRSINLTVKETPVEESTQTVVTEPVVTESVVTGSVVTDSVSVKSVSAEPVNSEEQITFSEQQLAEFADFVEQARIENAIPGVAAAVVDDKAVLLAKGFGVRDIRGSEEVTAETLFHIGSTQKSMTAMLIATLIDDGLLTWDTPIVEIYPDFTLADPEATKRVTMRHLLSMSSGIPATAEDDFDGESAEDLLLFIAETPLAGRPGEQFSYSNVAASIAGYIGVLAADNEAPNLYDGYAQLLQTQIFDPIGMTTATLSVEDALANPNHSASHIVDANGKVITAESYDFTGDPLAPSGSIKASVIEMARYMVTQVSRGIAPNGTRVVSEKNLTETWQPQIADEEEGGSYGLGWGVQTEDGVTIVSHEGSYDNFTSLLIFIPSAKSGMVLLTNSDDTGDFLERVSEQFVEMSITR